MSGDQNMIDEKDRLKIATIRPLTSVVRSEKSMTLMTKIPMIFAARIACFARDCCRIVCTVNLDCKNCHFYLDKKMLVLAIAE